MNALSPFGWAYAAGAGLRNALYDRGWLAAQDLGAPAISIGNITAGGTGKTPIVALVAEILIENGERVCILTRGYGRSDPAKRVVVSDGSAIFADETGGDEPVELARRLDGKAVISPTVTACTAVCPRQVWRLLCPRRWVPAPACAAISILFALMRPIPSAAASFPTGGFANRPQTFAVRMRSSSPRPKPRPTSPNSNKRSDASHETAIFRAESGVSGFTEAFRFSRRRKRRFNP